MKQSRISLVVIALFLLAPLAMAIDLTDSSSEEHEPFDLDDVQQRLRTIQELDAEAPAGNGDVNADGRLDVVDAIHTLRYLFGHAPRPVEIPCASHLETLPEVAALRNVSTYLEFNESDGQAEWILTAEASGGIERVRVHDSLHREIAGGAFLPRSDRGLEEIKLKVVETTLDGLLAAFPEGGYVVQAELATSERVAGLAELDHDLLPAPIFHHHTTPRGLQIEWLPVEGAAGYRLEFEGDEANFELTVELDRDRAAFTLPSELLENGVEYELTIGVVHENGNRSVVESAFKIGSSEAEPSLENEELDPGDSR